MARWLLHVETLDKPERYLKSQIDEAARIAWHLHRGRLVLAEQPRGRASNS